MSVSVPRLGGAPAVLRAIPSIRECASSPVHEWSNFETMHPDDVDAFAAAVARALEAHERAEAEYAAFRAKHAKIYQRLEGFPTRGVSMSPDAFYAQERRQRRELDAFLVDRIRTPERVQSGRAPRSRRTRSTSASRDGPDPEPSRVTDSPPPRPCEACGVSFAPKRKSTARLCSATCRQRDSRRRRSASHVTHSSHLTFELRESLKLR